MPWFGWIGLAGFVCAIFAFLLILLSLAKRADEEMPRQDAELLDLHIAVEYDEPKCKPGRFHGRVGPAYLPTRRGDL